MASGKIGSVSVVGRLVNENGRYIVVDQNGKKVDISEALHAATGFDVAIIITDRS